jgi:hypothetical protein
MLLSAGGKVSFWNHLEIRLGASFMYNKLSNKWHPGILTSIGYKF